MIPTFIQAVLVAMSLVFIAGTIVAYIERAQETSFYLSIGAIFMSLLTAHILDCERQHKTFDQIYHGSHRVDLVEYMVNHEGDTINRVYKLIEVPNVMVNASEPQ